VKGVLSGRIVAFGLYKAKLRTEKVVVVGEVYINSNNKKEKNSETIKWEVAQCSVKSLRNIFITKTKGLIKTICGEITGGMDWDKYLKDLNEAK